MHTPIRFLCHLITLSLFIAHTPYLKAQNLDKAWGKFYENDRKQAYELFNQVTANSANFAEAQLGLAMLASIDRPQVEAFKYFAKFYEKHPNPSPYLYALWDTEIINSGLNRKTAAEITFFKKIAASTTIDGALVAMANAALAKCYKLTKQPGYVEAADKIAAIVDWKLAGEFENISTSGFDKNYPPVFQPTADKPFVNKNGATINWFDIPQLRYDKWIDFTYYFWDNHNSINYAQNFVNSPAEQEVQLRVGVSGSIKVWINDNIVIAEPEERNNDIDTYITKVKLNKGANRVLVQVGESYAGRSNFMVRFTNDNGYPVTNLTFTKEVQPYTKESNYVAKPVDVFAEKFFMEKISSEPEQLLNYLLLANIYLRSDKIFESQKTLLAAQKRMPNCSYITKQLIELYIRSDNRTMLTTEREKLKDRDPEHPLAIEMFYNEAIDKKDYIEAARLAKKLEGIYGATDPDVLRRKINLAEYNKQRDELIALAEQAYALYPNFADFAETKFSIEKDVKNKDKSAENILLTYIKNNDNYSMLNTLANYYLEKSDLKSAIKLYEQDVKSDPIGCDLYIKQADAYYKIQKYASAEENIRKALLISPQSSDYWNELGLLCQQQGQKEKAIEAYKKAIAFNHANFTAIRDLRKLEDKKDIFSYFSTPDVYELVKKAPAANDYPDDNSLIIIAETQKVVYPSGASEEKHILAAKVLTNEGLNMLKEMNISGYGGQVSSVEKAEVIKANGSKVQAETNDATVVFTNLEVGDAINLIYIVENHNSGILANHFWDKFYLNFGIPSVKIKYGLLVANDTKFQYKVINGNLDPKISKADEFTLYEWENSDQEGIHYEDKMPVLTDVAPTLFISSIPDWNFISKWYYDLASYKAKADYEVKEAAAELFKDQKNLTELEKVKIIYNYILKKITYSSVSFRQSGLIPQRPATVINTRIGDCKDVSTLFVALCKEVGIKANLVLVNTRNNGLHDLELPSINFNHCMAKVNIQGKDQYYELTSNYLPFGANYASRINSQILDVTDEKQVSNLSLLNPATRTANTINRKKEVTIIDNNFEVKENTFQTGGPAGIIKSYYSDKSEREQEKLVTKRISQDYSNTQVNSVSFKGLETGSDTTKAAISYTLNDVISEVGGMAVFTLPWTTKAEAKDFVFTAKRKYAMDLSSAFSADNDTEIITLKLPDKKSIVQLPPAQTFSSKVADYSLSFKQTGNTVICTRTFKVKQQVIPLEDVAAFNDFYRKIIAADNKQLALKTKAKS